MPIKVRLSNAARITKREPTVTTAVNISRLTYQALGSLVQNKTLISLYDAGELPGEYVRVLDELNNLFLKVNYPSLYGNLIIADGIVELDEYLGSLGVSEEYPYSKDVVNIASWVDAEDRATVRVLMVYNDQNEPIQYLTANNDTEVLVRY